MEAVILVQLLEEEIDRIPIPNTNRMGKLRPPAFGLLRLLTNFLTFLY